MANDFDVSEPFAKKVLNENGITCQRKIAVTPLTEKHKNTRVMFCNQFSAINYASIPTIVFTDESSIQLTRERKICWKKRGEYPSGSTFEKIGRAKTLMVWGGIGKFGFKTELIIIKN